jgi:hypothetical protein
MEEKYPDKMGETVFAHWMNQRIREGQPVPRKLSEGVFKVEAKDGSGSIYSLDGKTWKRTQTWNG